jgi:hypothetical protein
VRGRRMMVVLGTVRYCGGRRRSRGLEWWSEQRTATPRVNRGPRAQCRSYITLFNTPAKRSCDSGVDGGGHGTWAARRTMQEVAGAAWTMDIGRGPAAEVKETAAAVVRRLSAKAAAVGGSGETVATLTAAVAAAERRAGRVAVGRAAALQAAAAAEATAAVGTLTHPATTSTAVRV